MRDERQKIAPYIARLAYIPYSTEGFSPCTTEIIKSFSTQIPQGAPSTNQYLVAGKWKTRIMSLVNWKILLNF
jgi:hypothetical protein